MPKFPPEDNPKPKKPGKKEEKTDKNLISDVAEAISGALTDVQPVPDRPPKKPKSQGNSIEMKEVLARIHKVIDRAQEDIDDEFVRKPKEIIQELADEEEYIIVKNKFWDAWLQKLIAQMISVKLWVIILITVLLCVDLITGAQFATLLGVIMGLKGTFQVASVWKNGHSAPNAMDKT